MKQKFESEGDDAEIQVLVKIDDAEEEYLTKEGINIRPKKVLTSDSSGEKVSPISLKKCARQTNFSSISKENQWH